MVVRGEQRYRNLSISSDFEKCIMLSFCFGLWTSSLQTHTQISGVQLRATKAKICPVIFLSVNYMEDLLRFKSRLKVFSHYLLFCNQHWDMAYKPS